MSFSEKKDLEGIQKFVLNRPKLMEELVREYSAKFPNVCKEKTNPVLPVLENGKVAVPERNKKYQNPVYAYPKESDSIEEIYGAEDIPVVQLEDIGERIKELDASIKNYKSNKEGRTPAKYRQLEECCVKYSIMLDRVNVINRQKLTESRRQMLLYLDELSVKIFEAA